MTRPADRPRTPVPSRPPGRRVPGSSSAGGCAVASAPGRCSSRRPRWSWSSSGLGLAVVRSPGWPRVQALFFDWDHAKASFPEIRDGFWLNVRLFLIAEPFILVLALAVALARSSRAALLVPLRLLAVVYTDLFRGIPTILLVLLLGLRHAGAAAAGDPQQRAVLGGRRAGAVVRRLRRRGLPRRHRVDPPLPGRQRRRRSGWAAAQTMRFVVVPQAVRRVVPPLLNDFVSLQKDTALVAVGGRLRRGLRGPRLRATSTSTTRPTSWSPAFFVVLTVPLARLTDWLQRAVRRAGTGGRADDRAGRRCRVLEVDGPAQVVRRPRGAARRRPDRARRTTWSA